MKKGRQLQIKDAPTKQSKGHELQVRDKEKSFYIPPTKGIPEYDAAKDPNCPRALVRKYNEDRLKYSRRSAALSNNGAGAQFIMKTLTSKFENPPIRMTPSLRAKAMNNILTNKEALNLKYDSKTGYPNSNNSNEKANLAEIEILQKVIIRENLLNELKKLLKNTQEVGSVITEVVEIVKAIRFQTADIVEDIDAWQCVQPFPRPFLYRGLNYLIKISTDLDYLDGYEDITERFCLEFKFNPFAYRDGGNIINPYNIVLADNNLTTNNSSSSNNKYSRKSTKGGDHESASQFIDGIEVFRLHNAEKTIQREFERLYHDRKNYDTAATTTINAIKNENSLAIGEHGMSTSMVMGFNTETSSVNNYFNQQSIGVHQNASTNNIRESVTAHDHYAQMTNYPDYNEFAVNNKINKVPKSDKKWNQKFDPRKRKAERIAVLTEEVGELKAMEAHLEDQIKVLVENYKQLSVKKQKNERKRVDAIEAHREVAAQHIAVEVSIIAADMQDINRNIKDLQRQMYFINLDRNRKRKVVKQLNIEINDDKRRSIIRAKLAEKIKEKGFVSGLKALNKVSMDLFISQLNLPGGAGSGKDSIVITEEDIMNTIDELSPQKVGAISVQDRRARGEEAMKVLSAKMDQQDDEDYLRLHQYLQKKEGLGLEARNASEDGDSFIYNDEGYSHDDDGSYVPFGASSIAEGDAYGHMEIPSVAYNEDYDDYDDGEGQHDPATKMSVAQYHYYTGNISDEGDDGDYNDDHVGHVSQQMVDTAVSGFVDKFRRSVSSPTLDDNLMEG